MLKEHLKKHFKSFKTIKLKRHHYMLWWFWIAAIIVIASIFGFQNIATHAGSDNLDDDLNISCYIQISKTRINIWETWQAKIGCTWLEKSFESINTWDIEYNTGILTVNTEDTYGHCLWEEWYYVCPFIYEGTSSWTSIFNLKTWSIFWNTQMVEWQIITVNEKTSTQDTFDCSIDINPLTNKVDWTGTIKITCKNTIKYTNWDLNSEALELPENNIIVVSNTGTYIGIEGWQEFTFTYTWNTAWTGTVTLKEWSIVGSEWEYNNEKESGIITIENNTIECKWKWNEVRIYKNETWSFELICDNNNFDTGDIKNQIKTTGITRPIVEITDLQKNAFSQGVEQEEITYTVTFKWIDTGSTKLTISWDINWQTITDNEEPSPQITVKEQEPQNPIKCTITAEPYIVNLNSWWNIIVKCDYINKDMSLTWGGLDYSGNITVSETSASDYSDMTFTFTYTWIRPGGSHLRLRQNSISWAVQWNDEAEFATWIHVNRPDPIKCDITAEDDTVDIDGTGNIIVTCKATKWINDTLSSTGLEYSGYIIDVQPIAERELLSWDTIAKYTFEYTWKAAPHTELKLLSWVLYDNSLYATNAEAEYESWITVNDPIPDCNTGWENDYFITPEFWALEPTDKQIACALYGSGNWDKTAYTMWRNSYEWWTSCSGYTGMTVITTGEIPTTIETNTIYVLNSTWFEIDNQNILLPSCSAIISKQENGTTIRTNWITISNWNSYWILDNISIAWDNNENWIQIHWSENTLNMVRVYNYKFWINIEGENNIANNLQIFNNEIWIRAFSSWNQINNTQVYRNDMWITVEWEKNHFENIETYQNKTWLFVSWDYNNFKDIEAIRNTMNVYVLSWTNNSATWLMRQYHVTKYTEYSGVIIYTERDDIITKSEISWFDRIYSEADLETTYTFDCEIWTISHTYTWDEPADITWAARDLCSWANRWEWTWTYTTTTWWWNYSIISITPLFTWMESEDYEYTVDTYPDNMTNPRYENGEYFNHFIDKPTWKSSEISKQIKDYSYWYEINTQKDTSRGGKVDTWNFIWSNVKKFEIKWEVYKHTNVHYTLTWTTTDTWSITNYNIKTNLFTNVSTITWYIWPSWTQFIDNNRNNIFTWIQINSWVELYVRTGDLTSYPVVVQMYWSSVNGQHDEATKYFAEHRYASTLSRPQITFDIEPQYMCTPLEVIHMTWTWTWYEYDITWFTSSSLILSGNIELNSDFYKNSTWKYTWSVNLTWWIWTITVKTDTVEDILQFSNVQEITKTYERDIYAPTINTTGFEVNECTQKWIQIDAQDVWCALISWYKLEWNLWNAWWQSSPIFWISSSTIWRTWGIGISKTWKIYVVDKFWNTGEKVITWNILDVRPTVTTWASESNPYIYETPVSWTVTINNVINLLWASEWACWTGDLTVTAISCGQWASWTTGNNSITVNMDPGTTTTTCTVTIKDNENSTTTWYIKFNADESYTVEKPQCTIKVNPTTIPKNYTWNITITCSWTNRWDLTDTGLDFDTSIITITNNISKSQDSTNTNTIYTMIFSWKTEWHTHFGIKTWAIAQWTIWNNYIEWDWINVITDTTLSCERSWANPNALVLWQTWNIQLNCPLDERSIIDAIKIINSVSLTTWNIIQYTWNISNTPTFTFYYTWSQIWGTKFQLSGQLNEYISFATVESEEIKVYSGIFEWCTRWQPTENPIWVWVEAYIDLICEDFEYHAENANELWSVILYSWNTNAIETWTAQWLSDSWEWSWVRFIYTGENVWKIQIKASWDSQWYLYLTDDYSSTIQVIDYENNRPKCTITGTEMVTVWQTWTITVDCINSYWILTTGITNDKLEYSWNIIVWDSIEEQPWTWEHKTFKFTFTWYIEWTWKIWLRTWAIKTVPGIENRYTEWNIITVVSGSNWIHICWWKDPNPDIITTGEAWYMVLDCIIDNRIPGFLIKSGDDNSLSQTLTLDNESGPRVLHYTWDNEWTTQYAISWNIGNVHIQTRRDDMGEENIRSKEIRVTNNWIILYLNPQNKISNQDITVNMSWENADWVKYYKTWTASLEFDVCESRGTWLEQIWWQFNGTEAISNNEEGTTYIYLCGKLGSDSLMKVWTYTIDTTKPECTLWKDPTEWTNSWVTVFVSSITETNPKLYSWTWFEDMIDTTWTKIVYTTGDYNFYMKDAAWNTWMCSTWVYNIDTEWPTWEIEYINGNWESGNSCTTWSVTIILHTWNSVSWYPELAFARNSTWNNAWTGNNTLTVTENGSWTGYIRDNAWNILALPYNVTWIVTTWPTAPVLQYPGSWETISTSNIDFSWTISSGDNCATISWYTMYILSWDVEIWSWTTDLTGINHGGLQNGTYSRYVIATDNFWQTTQSETQTFTVESGRPNCTITYEPPYESWWTNTNVTWTISCTWIDNIENNTHVFENNNEEYGFTVIDTWNNTRTYTWKATWIDKQAPWCNINASDPTNGQVTLTLTFTWEEHQDPSWYSWNGTEYGDSNTTTINTDWTYTWYVKDLAWNTWMCITTVNNVNPTKPTVYATNSSTTRKTWDISITMHVTWINLSWAKYIMDNEVKSFNECKSEGTLYTNWTGITYSTEWTWYLTLCAYDNNWNTGYRTGIYKLDKSNPVCGTWSYNPPLTEITSGTVTATLAWSTDNISWIRTWWWSCTINEHNGTCNVTISDNAGNTKSCTSSGATNIDKQEPTWEIITTYPSWHLENWCTSGNVILTLSWSDNNELAEAPYKRDNGEWTWNNTLTITENATWTWYIKDAAWNITGLAYNITWISHTWPRITLNLPASWAIMTWFVQFTWESESSDPVCQEIIWWYNIVVYSWTDEIFTWNTNETTTWKTLENWTYTWKIYVTDILWNTKESETRPFSINDQAPTCQVEYRPWSWTVTSWDVIATLTGCIPGTTWFNETWHTFTGNWTFVFTFENESWVSGNTTAIVDRIDKVPPVLHEVTPIWTTTDTTPNYTFSSTEPGRIEYSWACSSATTWAISWNNTITLNQLAYWTYSWCTITVTDAAGNKSDVLTISTFTIRQSWGGGGHWLKKDYCPDGDYSDSYYDRTCEWPIDICGVSTSKFNTEMKTAYLYAYQHGMTTICPIDDADLYWFIRRDQLAKMLTQYAINVLDLKPQAWKSGCTAYNDIANSSAEMKYYMKTACELDIMWLESDWKTPMKSFYPHWLVSRAEFWTTLSRLIYGDAYNLESEAENTYPWAWYGKHLEALKRDEIMTQIYGDRPQHLELRWYVMLMLMRHGKARLDNVKNIPYSTPEEIMDIYNKNKALTCETSYYESEDDYGSWMLYVKDNKLRENLKIHNEGNISSLIKNNKLYVRWDAIGSGMGMVADAEATALEELEALLEDDAYSFKNCNEAVKNINAFEVPSNIRFKSIGDWFTELANSFTSILE